MPHGLQLFILSRQFENFKQIVARNSDNRKIMKLIPLSDSSDRPCLLLRTEDVTILLDCGIDFGPSFHYLPATLVKSTRLESLPGWNPDGEEATFGGALRLGANGQVFVQSVPEIGIPDFSLVDPDQIDAVLISHHSSMLGLPFLVQQPGFRAVIYATDPTLQLGRLLMEELLEYFSRMPQEKSDSDWKLKDLYKKFPNPPSSDPNLWREMFTEDAVSACLEQVEVVAYREILEIFGFLRVVAYSSGYCIGSCNWSIKTDFETVSYLSGSSAVTAHPKALDWEPLTGADALILTSLTLSPVYHPDAMLAELCSAVVNTVRVGGNVLLPCQPTGVLYDLLECVGAHLEREAGLGEVPIYLVSPVADSTLAFANILAEWLAPSKQCRVYIPEDPFPHSQLLKSERLKAYSAIYKGLCKDFRSPCVVFAGHPSLRFGDAVHLLELWRNDNRNTIILTDSLYPMAEVLAPYQPLAMKAFYYPIDTRLDYNQAKKILEDLKPGKVFLPEQYSKPPLQYSSHSELVIHWEGAVEFRVGQVLDLVPEADSRMMKLDSAVTKNVNLVALESSEESACPLIGYLSAYDNQLVLKVGSASDEVDEKLPLPLPNLYGKLEPQRLISQLRKESLEAKLESQTDGEFVVSVAGGGVKIRVRGGTETEVDCETSNQKLRDSVTNALLHCLIML